jgi:hypothetical protein
MVRDPWQPIRRPWRDRSCCTEVGAGESFCLWVRPADTDGGIRPGISEIAERRTQNRNSRAERDGGIDRSLQVLTSAACFFEVGARPPIEVATFVDTHRIARP